METIVASLLVMCLGLGLIALFLRGYADFWFRVMVVNKGEALEQLETGDVPSRWRRKAAERLALSNGIFARAAGALLKWRYIRRLRALEGYIRAHRRLSADEKAGSLELIGETRRRWRDMPFTDMIG